MWKLLYSEMINVGQAMYNVYSINSPAILRPDRLIDEPIYLTSMQHINNIQHKLLPREMATSDSALNKW